MTINRGVQLKIQEEIEKVTSGKRLPELSDVDSKPYVRCVILEVLRWQPVTPLGQNVALFDFSTSLLTHLPVQTGIPHSCDEEDEYNGYFIPKDSIM